ncbi:MAG TPA: hypothetical protein VHQ22_09750 [Terriglobales bacterium]|jgi:hypothetical protein|nr:hypothetical protein [Terriglobales bacterium]
MRVRSYVVLFLVLGFAIISSRPTFAVPSYSRQTGLACSSCHYAPPELNAFGRKFKLEGYTFTTKGEVSEEKKDHNTPLHLLEVFPLSVVFDTSFTSTKAPQPNAQNGNFQFPQDASLFLAGAWAEHVGSFLQVTYDPQADHFTWDNTDIRYARTNGKLFEKSLTYGVTLNNNPTVEDLWNSTPAWGFPFLSTNVAPSPSAAAIINGSVAQDVAGVGGYTMWNDHLYLAGTLYRSEHIGGPQPNPGTGFGFNIRGVAPYWRLAWQTSSENNNFMIGTYGMHMKSSPGAVSGLEDGFTDWAADFQLDHTLPQFKGDVLSIRGTYIRENSSLVASANTGAAALVGHHLNTAQANVEYHFGTRVSTTGGFFDITGTADPVLFASSPVSGSANGSPQSTGFLMNLSWWPEQNINLGFQYTAYTRFNGAKTNYDGVGRDANGNNSVYLLARFVF